MCLCPSNGHLALSKFFLQFSFQRSPPHVIRFSLVGRCPMTLKCQFHFFPLVELQSRSVSTTIDVRSRFPIALHCIAAVYVVLGGLSDRQDLHRMQSRFVHSQVKYSEIFLSEIGYQLI